MKEFNQAVGALKQKIKADSVKAFDLSHLKVKKVNVGGSLLSLTHQELFKLPPNAFYGSTSKNWRGEDVITVFLGRPYDNAFITESDYYVEHSVTGNSSLTLTNPITLESSEEGLKLLFFPDGCEIEETTGVFEPAVGKLNFVANLTLDNGDLLKIDTTIHVGTAVESKFEGMALVVNDDSKEHNSVPLFGVSKLGIADFRRVEQEISCYVAGEVSHIENVMAREYKERFSRKQKTIDVTTEQTSETEIENLSDTSTSERDEMSSEASSVLNEDHSKSFGANAMVSGGQKPAYQFSVSASMDLSSSSSASDSNSMAKNYAQDITERTLERVVNKVSRKRTSRMLQEFEEHNKHGFDNTEGDKNITGVYRWVDKIYKNHLVNYGKRLMYEFSIPEPAKFFKEAILKRNSNGSNSRPIPIEPIHINNLPIKNSSEIFESNYLGLAKEYGVEVEAPASEWITVSKSYSYWGDRDSTNSRDDYAAALEDIRVPDNYEAVRGFLDGSKDVEYDYDYHFDVIVGDDILITEFKDGEFSEKIEFKSPIQDMVPVSIQADEVYNAAFNITLTCKRSEEYFTKWQNDTYNALLLAYKDAKLKYEEEMMAYIAENEMDEDGKPVKFNPLFNRSIEKREIKRVAIELMTEPFNVKISKDNYVLDSNKLSKVKRTAGFQNHASVVKFFEQAFDWEIMSYVFYPYFYADESEWVNLFQSTDAADPIFQMFLQSGMGKTVVPVRPGFEDAVNWYLATGEVWNGRGIIVDQDDDLYVSIAEEMQTVDGEIEDTWETRVPTALTLLQVKDSGLPCFDEDHDHSA